MEKFNRKEEREIRRRIIEQCNEDTCGSWEFVWALKDEDRNFEMYKAQADIVEGLLKEGRIRVFKSQRDESKPEILNKDNLIPTTFDNNRMRHELLYHLDREKFQDYYFFQTTISGDREYFLLGWIKRILRERDPLGLISMGSPEDEYDTEAHDIFTEIEKNLVSPDLNQIVSSEFISMFGIGGYTDTKQAKDAFTQVAQDIESKMKELGDSIK